jgi:YqaJ-like viral recombinase domain
MIYHACAPRSREWYALRLGIPTSSEFSRIITPKTMKISSQAPGYMNRLLAEWVTGQQVENFQSEYMVRGQELEDEAIAAYEMLTGAETSPGGFVTTDDGMLGCSPDRLIGNDGDLELKCPLIQTQIGYALNGLDDEYKCQVQGRLMIHEREWVDLFSYHPLFSIPPLRVYRDEKFIRVLRPVLEQFVTTMLNARVLLEQRYGPFVRVEPKDEPAPMDGLGVSNEDVEEILRGRDNV